MKSNHMQLPPVRQSELHSDLKIQEKDELQWKKLKAEGLDENGEKEAKLRRSFNVILAKYGMDGKKDTRGLESNFLKDHDIKEGDMFDDPRLDKLWNKAKSSGKFSEEELLSLQREFQHHKEKIQEYNIVMDTVSRTEEGHKNAISPLQGDMQEEALHQKHTELKEKMRNLNQGFERLRKLSHEGFSEDSEFKEPRVIELWEMARRANLSGSELDSLKEELKHFETKVEKHQHYQEQLDLSHQKLKHVEALGDEEHIHRTKEKYNSMAEKTREMGYKAKSSGKFSEEELLSLQREFQHHKEKIQEYNIVMDTVSRTEEGHKNAISPLQGDMQEEALHQKHTELKEKMRNLNQGFERLRKLSHEGFSEDSEFKEPRVIELWEMARRANLSGSELDSLKEELKHFETKVEKHQHYQEQLDLSHQKLKHVEALGDEEHIHRTKEKYNSMAEKTREMGYKVGLNATR
ncbi:hypothetical protein SKAU_G00394560 [Synaphobranchus kaupii]|uniref:Alpha-2-macroglobulin receptor-associated protein n=1 Tax=Synaphobranchus kaupii TaxID=118154 RepID=A0A9Q1EC73_SYNKA|nr:hypothetical protein SKAU_G00394560 [Synaphobranchus kaupii]